MPLALNFKLNLKVTALPVQCLFTHNLKETLTSSYCYQ